MKKAEAAAKMTQKVAELVNNGWSITFDLRGSYTNIEGYMTFAKGNRRVIVYMEETVSHRYIGELRVKCAEIELGRGETLGRNYVWPDAWDKNVTAEYVFYEISDGHHEWFGTKEEAEEAQKVRRARWKASYMGMTRKNFKVTPRVLGTIRKVYGFKTIKAENAEVYRIGDTYYIKNTKSGRTASFSL